MKPRAERINKSSSLLALGQKTKVSGDVSPSSQSHLEHVAVYVILLGWSCMSNLRWAACALLASLCLIPACCAAAAGELPADPAAGSVLSGTVSDPSGFKVPHADIHVQSTDQQTPALSRDITTDAAGHFSLALPPGKYDLMIVAPGFEPKVIPVTLTAKAAHPDIDAKLTIATQAESITVPSNTAASTAAADNQTALVFKGSELKTFSDDDSTFQQQIQALAGGDGNSPDIYVDGFSGGRFPPKNSIREIRINQNPYSAEYEEIGYGRIEIFTKPGSDQLHGFAELAGNDDVLNTPDPFLSGAQPPYHSLFFYGNLSGPINKKTSFFANVFVNDQQSNAVVHAFTLDSNLQPITLSQAVAAPAVSSDYSLRLDRTITINNTLTARYDLDRSSADNAGVGLLVLPEAGTNSLTTAQTLQISDTQILGPKMVSEAHFQYQRTRLHQTSDSSAPSINVEGAFTGGGSSSQITGDNQDRYEIQEIFTREQKSHFFRFGGRYRLLRDANLSTAGYNGAFTFPSLTSYQITLQGLAAAETDQQIRSTCVTTSTGPECGGATQFNLTAGQPSAVVLTGDLALFAEDEWKLSKSVTLDLGFRLESQTAIPDHLDAAPRLGFAWAIGQHDRKPAFVVLRGGGGLFYDRFASGNILTSIRENGLTQPSYFVTDPSFYPTIPPTSALTATLPTIYQIGPHLRSEYAIVSGVSAERSLWKKGSVSLNYINNRGVHQWDSVNINAPLPGTYNPGNPADGIPATGAYPLGTTQPVYQFQSNGISNNSRFFVRTNLNPTKKLFLFGFFTIRHGYSDAFGASSFPSNSYNLSADYGRLPYPNKRLFLGGYWELPFGLTANAFLSATAAQPFNITTGTDLNGDTQYNDRPAFATKPSGSSEIYKTRFGTFDANPQPGEKTIPINYGTGPSFAELDLGFGRTFKFGPRPPAPKPDPNAPKPPTAPAAKPGSPAPKVAKPDPRFSLSFSFDAENALNHVNAGAPVGVLTSPSFGQSISLNSPFGSVTATRVINLRTTFSF